jgi:2'-5' RNA ligase
LRAFLALDLPEEVRTYLKKVTEMLSKEEDGVKWVRTENQHLTLKFFGEIEEGLKEKIVLVMRRVAPKLHPIRVSLKSVEGFPKNTFARVIVITLSEGVEEVKGMFHILEEELAREGFQREEREFVPHITLGRRKGFRPLRTFAVDPIRFVFEDLVLYKSTLTREGPIYEPIFKLKLKERGA